MGYGLDNGVARPFAVVATPLAALALLLAIWILMMGADTPRSNGATTRSHPLWIELHARSRPGRIIATRKRWRKRHGWQQDTGREGEAPAHSRANWHQPIRWNRKANRKGLERPTSGSACSAPRSPTCSTTRCPTSGATICSGSIAGTPHLDWLLLTKRIGNAYDMLPIGWGEGFANVWIGASVVNQAEADRDIPKLLEIPAQVRFVSYEPALGPVDFTKFLGETDCPALEGGQHCEHWYDGDAPCCACGAFGALDWIICGGESGPGARPMHPDWARAARDACVSTDTPFFFKQWGEWVPANDREFWRVGKKRAGAVLDGREHKEFPRPAMELAA